MEKCLRLTAELVLETRGARAVAWPEEGKCEKAQLGVSW